MPPTDALRTGPWARRCLGALLVLALGMACTVLTALAASTSMTGMAGMTGMTGMTGVTQVDRGADVVPVLLPSAEAAVGVVSELAPVGLHDSCDSACVSALGAVCAGAAGLTIPLLALLLATRRYTFTGLLTRAPARDVRGRWPRTTPWTTPSLAALCVLRV